jgi:hypothetical protein
MEQLTQLLELIYGDFCISEDFSEYAFTQILTLVYRYSRPPAIGMVKYHVAATLADAGKT